MNTTYATKLTQTKTYTVRYVKACTDFHKRESSHKISSKKDYSKQDTNKSKSHQGTGLISGDQPASHLSLMILALNTLAKNTFNT